MTDFSRIGSTSVGLGLSLELSTMHSWESTVALTENFRFPHPLIALVSPPESSGRGGGDSSHTIATAGDD